MKNGPDNDGHTVASLRDVRPAPSRVELASQLDIDVLAALRKRPWIALAVAAVVLGLGYEFYLRRVSKEYRAEAAVYVSPTYFKNLEQGREQLQISYDTLVNQQILTIRRYDILLESIKRLRKQNIEWQEHNESETATVLRLARQLELQHVPDSYEVLIGLTSEKRAWVAPIVNTITNTYIEKSQQEEMADRSTQMEALRLEQARVARELQGMLDQQTQLSQKLSTVVLDNAAAGDEALLSRTRQVRDDARTRRVEAEAQLKVVSEAVASGANSFLNTLVDDAAIKDPGIKARFDNLLQRQLELEKSTAGLKSEHPLHQAAEAEIAEIGRQTDQISAGVRTDAAARLMTKLKSEINRNQILESELDKEIGSISQRMHGVAKDIQHGQGLNAEIDRLRRLQAAVTSRIDDLSMPPNSATYLRIFAKAQPPLEPTPSMSKKRLAIVLAAACCLALMVVLGLDFADQRIFSPSDVQRAVGFPPLGVVLGAETRTLTFAQEHFRRLINGIQRGVDAQDAKSILITPLRAPTSDVLINDIAAALTARGVKTVIVDAHTDRTEEHRNGHMPFGLVGPNRRERPARVAGGHLASRIDMAPAEISQAPLVSRVKVLLSTMAREYDVVLIDAPPVAVSADTEFLASISDITLLVVQTGVVTRSELIRGARLLGRIGARSIGVIMSEVELGKAGVGLNQDYKRFHTLAASETHA